MYGKIGTPKKKKHCLTLQYIHDQPRIPVGVEEEHVPERAVGEGGAEDGDVVDGGPVVDRRLVFDLQTQTVDDARRRPNNVLKKEILKNGDLSFGIRRF